MKKILQNKKTYKKESNKKKASDENKQPNRQYVRIQKRNKKRKLKNLGNEK